MAFAEFKGICSGDILTFEPKDPNVLLPELLPFICQTDAFFDHALGTSAGSLSPRTSYKALQDFEFPLPPIEEQKRIAEILWSADEIVEAWSQSIKDLRFLIGKLGVAYFKDTGFGHHKFSDYVAESAYGPRFSNTLYSQDGAIGQIRTTDISDDGTINYSTVPMANLDIDDYKSHILKPGDLLISRSGTTGIACVFDEQPVPMLPGAFLIRFRLNESLYPKFVKEYFNSPIGRRHTSRLAQGGVQNNLRGSALLNEELPIPSVVDQKSVVDMFVRLREDLVKLHEHRAKSKAILMAFCNQALTGKK